MSFKSKKSQYRTYDAAECAVFKKTNEEFGGLSNMAPGFPLQVNGVKIATTEALYQACRFPTLPDVQLSIISQHSPMTAKMKSKPHRKETRSDWDKVRVPIMRWCLRLKLAQNWQKFSKLLESTGNKPIVEESRKDDFWGAKRSEDGILVGRNVLGRLLMELREELRGPDAEKLKNITPPNIPDLLLYGKEIATLEEPEQLATEKGNLFAEPMIKVPQEKMEEKVWGGSSIPRECKRLIEVDFPLAKVSYYAAKEKSIRHGHPSTLHLWWARRPLASCRAVLLGLLLPDPEDPHCPPEFKTHARTLLAEVAGPTRGYALKGTDAALRKALLEFIGDFSNWDLSSDPLYLHVSRSLVQAAHPEETPLVVDPFAGGGSIPLEALRLGCEAFASDLNPVACLILKVLLEDIPRHGDKLAEELREVGEQIKAEAEKELAKFYPKDPDGAQPIAYLWARTVRCEAVGCGAEIPLVRSFWLCRKQGRKIALRYQVNRKASPPQVELEIFTPEKDSEVLAGTVTRAKAKCLVCGSVLPPERVRAQLAAQKGGADVIFDEQGKRQGGARLLAVVTLNPKQKRRLYRLPQEQDYAVVYQGTQALSEKIIQPLPGSLSAIPDEPTPAGGGSGAGRAFSVQKYGMMQWGDLFTSRQKLGLLTLSKIAREIPTEIPKEAIALLISKFIELVTANCLWKPVAECPRKIFNMQALPMQWSFAEGVITSKSSGSLSVVLSNIDHTLHAIGSNWSIGHIQLSDACAIPIPDDSYGVWFTDPPYYDAVPYSDLSDFFIVWLKRNLHSYSLINDPFDADNPLTPKLLEIVQDETKLFNRRPKDRQFFEERMACAFNEGRRVLSEDGIGCVVFAHKTTEGWDALLSGMLNAGWTITASWPVATEQEHRPRARESAALATSVHLVCRPRSSNAGVGDWAEVKAGMEARVRDWMLRLDKEGIRGADALFACIGPAMEVYSRYDRVETPAGLEVPLGGDPEAMDPHQRGFLAYVFEAVSRDALRQVLGQADTEGFEEDARLCALFLWTLQATRLNGNGKKTKVPDEKSEETADLDNDETEKPKEAKAGLTLPFDTFIRITRPLGIHYQAWEQQIIDIEKGIVRLLPVLDRQEALFGKTLDVQTVELRKSRGQQSLFPEEIQTHPKISRAAGKPLEQLTTLDRLHQAMILYAAGQTLALKTLLDEEAHRGRRFERLAFALMALYPEKTPERKWLEGIQAMIKTK